MAANPIPKDTKESLVSLMGMSDNLSFMKTLLVKNVKWEDWSMEGGGAKGQSNTEDCNG